MSAYRSLETIKNIGVIGTGTIGASWATYFLSRGFKVKAWDPGDGWKDRILDFINNAWPQMNALGAKKEFQETNIELCSSLEDALSEVEFVQESAPEQLQIKRSLFKKIDKYTDNSLIISWEFSCSGLFWAVHVRLTINRPSQAWRVNTCFSICFMWLLSFL